MSDTDTIKELCRALPDDLDADQFNTCLDVVACAFFAGRNAARPPGGLDGMIVAFGENGDDNTLNAMFPWPVLEVTTVQRSSVVVTNNRFARGGDGFVVLRCTEWPDEDTEPDPAAPATVIPVAQIIAITIP